MKERSEGKEKLSGWLTPQNDRERQLRASLNIMAQVFGKRTRDVLYDAIEEYIERHRREIKF